ncbi:putative Calcyclin-binding protein [Blattamonas nauphoetae]|uniref:Calcyclin-binding protein n=1 Tax=Blattamonas nauphoetae TaxID=2049346 RepID=A0ABQ9YM62_9EUKA|nr:putative Calcyclin-binding protein [Blattamonas nauphoetae]
MTVQQDYQLDIEEVERFISQTSRPRVKEGLQKFLKELKQDKDLLPEKVDDSASTITPTKTYIDVTTCGFDDDGSEVVLFWELPNIGTYPKEQIEVEFNEESVFATIDGFQGRNYRFAIAPLFQRIVPERSTFKKLKNRVQFILAKENTGTHWDKLKKQSDPLSKNMGKKKDKKDADPGSELMNLMKDMYQNGDDEMKRTIAKAWTESRDKQMKGEDMGMPPM